jgi:hypothetical protein
MVLFRIDFGGKRVPQRWIDWVMQTVLGGQVCVNVNVERSPYFRTFRGLGRVILHLLFSSMWLQMF